MGKLVHVAVGVIYGADGRILIAKRPDTVHQGGLWEFPGGKVDAGETVTQALARELREELNIAVLASEPLIQIRHHYVDKSVLLDVHAITDFSGVPCGNEGQPIQWVNRSQLYQYEFPAANRPIISAINLPSCYAICGPLLNESEFLMRAARAIDAGAGLLQLRIPNFLLHEHQSLVQQLADLTLSRKTLLQINTSPQLFTRIQELSPRHIGLHLNRHEAASLDKRPVGADILLGVSCHNEQEIHHAQSIGADYLLLSPVKSTSSHPDAIPLGWISFSKLVEFASVPVYALGGVVAADLPEARKHGAQGVAGISAWW